MTIFQIPLANAMAWLLALAFGMHGLTGLVIVATGASLIVGAK